MPVPPTPIVPGGIASAPGGPFQETSLPFQNPSTTGLAYIGNVSQEWEADIPVWETPFETDPKPYAYRLLYNVKVSAFRSLARDAAGPYGGYHIGESNFKTSKGGILSFYREFARKPDSRNEFETYVYPYQIANTGTSPSITEIPATVTSRVQYDYFYTNQPETITLDKAPKAILINGVLHFLHGWGSLIVGNQMLAEDATLQIWKGKIYERKQRFIEVRNFVNEV